MPLLISDACVFINMEDGKLTRKMFSLPYQFGTIDFIFKDELEDRHADLLKYGLKLLPQDEKIIELTLKLIMTHKKPSRYDLAALALAKYQSLTLLTDDRDLRNAAQKEKVNLHGSIWIVEELLLHKKIQKKTAIDAFERMKKSGSHLPESDIKNMLLNY